MAVEQGPSQGNGQRPRRKEPSLEPPAYILNQHGGRVLDPATSVRLGDQEVRPTLYVGAALLVRTSAYSRVEPDLQRAAEAANLTLEPDPTDPELTALAEEYGLTELAGKVLVTRVRLVPTTDPALPPDAWTVLQNFRALTRDRRELAEQVSLEHLMSANPGLHGAPMFGGPMFGGSVAGAPMFGGPMFGGPMFGGSAIGEYTAPGFGGRAPVVWLGPEPRRCGKQEINGRRPVIAVLDTGAGQHPWLPELDPDPTLDKGIVDRRPKVVGLDIGHTGAQPPIPDPEDTGSYNSPLEGTLDVAAGHGTFISGLIRQICPDANILAIRVMHSDAVVEEGHLLDAVNRLLFRQALAVKLNKPAWAVDVVSMSFGHYHELKSDEVFDQLLLESVRQLGRLGVAVVASAGNDATPRHMYPAGFTPNGKGPVTKPEKDVVPVVAVGARNPNGKTIALFSNGGEWVTCHETGAALVSTMPVTFNGSSQSRHAVSVVGDGDRASIDMDDYSGGFGTWSGTSFAGPVVAAKVAAHLAASGQLANISPAVACDRAWKALEHTAGLKRPAT